MKLQELVEKAYKERFSVAGFNVYNLESAKAAARAADVTGKPALLMTTENALEYAGFGQLVAIVLRIKKDAKTPIFLHYDHGTSVDLLKLAMKSSYDSVMFDGSKLPIDQNIMLSKELRKLAHSKGVVFEAEIGRVGGEEENIRSEEFKTNPPEALRFYNEVKPDMLAVAIGNIHGRETSAEHLDFSLLAKIQDLVKCPLVLHGCSNRNPREYQVAVSQGVVKINIDTELREAFVDGLKRALHKKETNPRKILSYASDEVTKCAKEKIEIFSCSKLHC
ncbi:MAG: class II fructose-bisphosphate aldolase family protein [Candidatus Berkelbacteria bacterium]|nr:class II fructose-bisphosphate aldolase family protein [Candidatus Berkelbacteria bacterium]